MTKRFILVLLVLSSLAHARIISYAPVSDRYGVPAVQHRMNRHYVLMEHTTAGTGRGQLVIYDSRGIEEPRVILPKGPAPDVALVASAVWEGDDGPPRILVVTDASVEGDNTDKRQRFLYSADGGASWKVLAIAPGTNVPPSTPVFDVGGPIVRSRGSQIRIGNAAMPFVVMVPQMGAYVVTGVKTDGSLVPLASFATAPVPALVGSNREATRFLVAGAPNTPDGPPIQASLFTLDLDGRLVAIDTLAASPIGYEGWITPDGAVYAENRGYNYEHRVFNLPKTLHVYKNNTKSLVAEPIPGAPINNVFFAVPTFDYSGAWILKRATGQPTTLLKHEPGSIAVEQWRDISTPEVEALHPAASGRRVLIQVHRPRPQIDQRLFIDPALAIWEIGTPAPRRYDELFLNEGPSKAFVHLDVDAVLKGESFVFDSAAIVVPTGGSQLSSAPGGGDVIQEWGVVRASLAQKLLIPSIGRTPGAYGSYWRTDVIFRNPEADAMSVDIEFVSTNDEFRMTKKLELPAREIVVAEDVLRSLFGLESGLGALYLTPPIGRAISATSRTYTDSTRGTYGMGIAAVDLHAAASARFPVTFAGAFQGTNFRTNLIAANVGHERAQTSLAAWGPSGQTGKSGFSFETEARRQVQINGVGTFLDVHPFETGALSFRPVAGEVIAGVVALDNRTNDPTYFPPDLPAPFLRTIPVIGHLDGANGSKFRSDLFLYNPTEQVRVITLSCKRWDVLESEAFLTLTLLPNESKVIRDVLKSAFGRTGLARLRYVSRSQTGPIESNGIRATSRTYTIDPDGGTYGILVPPLNNFQIAASGDTLEILGARGDARYRTNLALVELSPNPSTATARVRIEVVDEKGKSVELFDTYVPFGGGIQLNDIFRGRGLGDGPRAALIRVSALSGLIGAYATMVDNGTNDPTFLAAALGSHD